MVSVVFQRYSDRFLTSKDTSFLYGLCLFWEGEGLVDQKDRIYFFPFSVGFRYHPDFGHGQEKILTENEVFGETSSLGWEVDWSDLLSVLGETVVDSDPLRSFSSLRPSSFQMPDGYKDSYHCDLSYKTDNLDIPFIFDLSINFPPFIVGGEPFCRPDQPSSSHSLYSVYHWAETFRIFKD